MFIREEQIGDCRLILGDSLEVLSTLESFDAVVTDPPYGIEGGKGGDSSAFGKGGYDAPFEDSPDYIRRVCVDVIEQCLSLAGALAVTPGNRCLAMYPQARDIGCFWTPAAMTHGPWGMTTFQPILYYGKDWRAGKGAYPSGRQVTEASEKNGHPCPKPIKAWQWLVDKVCPPNGSVLDPFMGSGTTGVACAKTGRSFVGIELHEPYFEIACKRVREAYAQGDMFVAPPAPMVEQLSILYGAA